MKQLSIKLDDLPDEILVFILRKLHSVEVLYSLIAVNKRLNRIVHDSLFTSHLTLTYFLDNFAYRLPDPMLVRFCSLILPSIRHKIKWLDLEPTSMQRILCTPTYPNLYGLGLYSIDLGEVLSLFSGKLFQLGINDKQIKIR